MSRFDSVQWFDGKNAQGKFVLELTYQSGGTAYIKNADIDVLCHYWRLLKDCPEVVDGIIYNPTGEKVEYTLREVA